MGKRGRRKPDLKTLSELELAVMNVVWNLEECTSTEVIEEFSKQRPLAPTTVRTVLTKIEKKGYIERIPSLARGYRFRPCISRDDVAESTLHRLISNLYQGSPRLALAHLLKDERIDDGELAEIRKILRNYGRGKSGDKRS